MTLFYTRICVPLRNKCEHMFCLFVLYLIFFLG